MDAAAPAGSWPEDGRLARASDLLVAAPRALQRSEQRRGPARARITLAHPRVLCGVMDVEYLHCTIRDAIENLVWITAERHRMNARALGRTARTFRPARNVCDDTPDAPLYDRCNRRIMNDQPVGNCIEVFERFLGVDDFHLPRNFANTAST